MRVVVVKASSVAENKITLDLFEAAADVSKKF